MSTAKQHSYSNEHIRVSFDGSKCAHAGYCFRELHDVFDGDRDPPIDLGGASLAEIVRVVEKCPSSALTYERLDGASNEIATQQAYAVIVPNGPLAIRGMLQLTEQPYTRLTLCRCGHSQNKPYCDGSHHQHSFDDQANAAPVAVDSSIEPSAVTFTPYPNGPVGFSGSLVFKTLAGDTICQRSKGGLCRCGASQNKPFCDGTHAKIGFKA